MISLTVQKLKANMSYLLRHFKNDTILVKVHKKENDYSPSILVLSFIKNLWVMQFEKGITNGFTNK